MLVSHSPSILLHRLAVTEGETLPAAMALVAKYRGEVLNRKAMDNLEAPQEGTKPTAIPDTHLDKRA